jgi:uncharacterized protein (TIGR03435 family)
MKKRMLGLVALAALFVPTLYAQSAAAPAPGDLTGNWQGTIKAGGKDVRIVVKIAKTDKGWSATLFNADQASQSLNASSVTLAGSELKFSVDLMSANYVGKVGSDGKLITGTWTQGGQSLPLTLVLATPETAWDIPEAPKPPTPMAANADPSFDVATIKPNPSGETHIQGLTLQGRNFAVRNGSLEDLIAFAYNVHMQQVVSGPSWMNSDRYDIAAVPDQTGTPSVDQMRTMVRKLLADRYKLTIHHEKKELPAYVLTVGKGAQKLTPDQSGGQVPGMGMSPGNGGLTMRIVNASLSDYTSFLQMIVLDHPVVDQTGIKGRFDFNVTFTPNDSQFNGHPPKLPEQATATESAPNLADAIQQQLGLKLSAERTPVDVIVIDHVEKPSPN